MKLSVKDKINRHNDNQMTYENIAMPEVDVDVFYDNDEENFVRAKMKLKRVLRYHHLTRDFVDEKDYPPTQEYFLYSDQKVVALYYIICFLTRVTIFRTPTCLTVPTDTQTSSSSFSWTTFLCPAVANIETKTRTISTRLVLNMLVKVKIIDQCSLVP